MLFSTWANALRANLPPPSLDANRGRIYFVPTPFFHITALISVQLPLTAWGGKSVCFWKWFVCFTSAPLALSSLPPNLKLTTNFAQKGPNPRP